MSTEPPICSTCGQPKVRKNDKQWWCYPCRSKDIIAWRHSIKQKALDHYGRRCACCGESHELFLQFDHIEGGGNVHRKDQKIAGGNGMAVWLYRNHFPIGYQTLCANCNIGRHLNNGRCPHDVPTE